MESEKFMQADINFANYLREKLYPKSKEFKISDNGGIVEMNSDSFYHFIAFDGEDSEKSYWVYENVDYPGAIYRSNGDPGEPEEIEAVEIADFKNLRDAILELFTLEARQQIISIAECYEEIESSELDKESEVFK